MISFRNGILELNLTFLLPARVGVWLAGKRNAARLSAGWQSASDEWRSRRGIVSFSRKLEREQSKEPTA
jgi:hypothetical protein